MRQHMRRRRIQDSGQPFRGWVAERLTSVICSHLVWSFQFSVHCVLTVDHIWIVWLPFALVIDRLLLGRPGFEQGCDSQTTRRKTLAEGQVTRRGLSTLRC